MKYDQNNAYQLWIDENKLKVKGAKMNDDQTLYEQHQQSLIKRGDTLKKYYTIIDDNDKVYTPLMNEDLDSVVNLASSMATSNPSRVFTVFTAERMLRFSDTPVIEKKFE